jgi:hypothetical protein
VWLHSASFFSLPALSVANLPPRWASGGQARGKYSAVNGPPIAHFYSAPRPAPAGGYFIRNSLDREKIKNAAPYHFIDTSFYPSRIPAFPVNLKAKKIRSLAAADRLLSKGSLFTHSRQDT